MKGVKSYSGTKKDTSESKKDTLAYSGSKKDK